MRGLHEKISQVIFSSKILELLAFKLEYSLVPPRGGSEAQPTAHCSRLIPATAESSPEALSREKEKEAQSHFG